MACLGIDFGTSNTAAGLVLNGKPQVIAIEDGSKTLPTAVFLDFHAREALYGRKAVAAMIDGQEGRFMRALKSVLGTPLLRETRQFMNERMSLLEVIARFLAEIKHRAEQAINQSFTGAMSGRPVRFHSASEARNAQALVDLEEAYRLAGFQTVDFLPEPEAAAMAVAGEGRILIVDIGGGTSDFTLCERISGQMQIIASEGMRLGGTDFDKTLSLAHVMPLLGYGAEIGNEMGPGSHQAPRALFQDLASWEKITFVYNPSLLRDVQRWERLAREPERFSRLGEVLEMHLGHDIAFAVEAAKIKANDEQRAEIDLRFIEKGLTADLYQLALQHALAGAAEQISDCARAVLAKADCKAASVDRVVFVGGSSLLGVVQAGIHAVLPDAAYETSEVFTAVVDGLAIASGGDL